MNTKPQYRRPMSETPEKFPVIGFKDNKPVSALRDLGEFFDAKYNCGYTGWQPLEILPEAPRELTQEEKDDNTYDEWRETHNDPKGRDIWHAALAWERSRNAEGREQIEARLKETEARLAQQCEALKSYVDRFEAMRVRNVEIKEEAAQAVARERKVIAALLPKLDDFDGTFNALADLLDGSDVNIRISDALRLLHDRLSASAEKGQS